MVIFLMELKNRMVRTTAPANKPMSYWVVIMWLKAPAMFHPEGEFNIVRAVLAGVNAVVTLGDEAFPEFAFEGFVALL